MKGSGDMERKAEKAGDGQSNAPMRARSGSACKGVSKRLAAVLAGVALICATLAGAAALCDAPLDGGGNVPTEAARNQGSAHPKKTAEEGAAEDARPGAGENRAEISAPSAESDDPAESDGPDLRAAGPEAIAAASSSHDAQRPAEVGSPQGPAPSEPVAPSDSAPDPTPADQAPQPDPVPPPPEAVQPEPPETHWVYGYKCGSCPFHSTDVSAMEEHQRNQMLAGADHGAYGSWSWEEG